VSSGLAPPWSALALWAAVEPENAAPAGQIATGRWEGCPSGTKGGLG
jgi:hypothetical protein